MDTATRAALVTHALLVAGGTIDDSWQAVDDAVAECGVPTDDATLRAVMLHLQRDALAMVGG